MAPSGSVADAIIAHGTNLNVSEEEIRNHWNTGWQGMYREELTLLIVYGKLTGSWSNVLAHCAVQHAAVEVLTDTLGRALPETEENWDRIHEARRAALVHDWSKRRERQRADFSHEEIVLGNVAYEATTTPFKRTLITATGPDFLERFLRGDATTLELVLFYADDICKGGEIVPLLERIAEVEARRQDLNENKVLTERLGGRKYWDVEREVGETAERLIFYTLYCVLNGARKFGISDPRELPSWIRARVEERIRNT